MHIDSKRSCYQRELNKVLSRQASRAQLQLEQHRQHNTYLTDRLCQAQLRKPIHCQYHMKVAPERI